jgi:cyclopropane fatty-acyl-phospholipid synthase-like methyltransferase
MNDSNERIIPLYEENAAAWDQQRGRDLFEKPWLDRFTSLLPPGGSILDLGCGMAEPIARYLISQGFSLTGVDSSPSLIALGKQRFPAHTWIVSDMRTLSLPRTFDGILAWHSFFHLSPENQRPMFPRFASLSHPNTALMFTSGHSHGHAIGTWQNEPLYHGSLAPAEYHILLTNNQFTVLHHVVSDPTCGHATIWLAQRHLSASRP